MKTKRVLTILLTIALCLTSFGCAHTYVNAWDKEKVEICGNKWAKSDDYVNRAQSLSCPIPMKVAGRWVSSGYQRVEDTIYEVSKWCVTYQCKY